MAQPIDRIIDRQINNWDRIRDVLGHKGEPEAAEGEAPVKPQPVIAISRQLGSGARHVTDILSKRTGWEIFGLNLIEKVAENMNVQRKVIDRLDESSKSDMEMFIRGLLAGRHVDHDEYFRSLLRVMRAFVLQGGVILLGRGSTFVVERERGVRVRLIAPMEVRVKNLMRDSHLDEKEAKRRIQESDRNRGEFIRRFYKAEPGDPENYDLIVNTGRCETKTAVSMIMTALEPLQE